MISQANITPATPMGANLVTGGGATFRAWAPRATAVYVNGTFAGTPYTTQSDDLLMANNGNGYWTGFMPDAQDGDPYHFWVVGAGSSGYKRDPYAREMATDAPFPNCSCLIRSGTAYPWHDSAFVTPDFSSMIVYQLHVGTYAPGTPGSAGTFLDVIGKIEYLVALGINVLQPLPIDEIEAQPSMGYNGADYFSPDFPYVVYDQAALAGYLSTINALLANRGFPPLGIGDINSGPAQLKVMVDLCHLYGIAVAFDVVYNHAGGFEGDDQSLYFWDRAVDSDNNQSLYFTNQGFAGGLSFALWNNDVRQFIINSVKYYIDEFHVDGFRYDEISALLSLNEDSGWTFCCDLTDTLRYLKPRLLQNAEYWPFEFPNYPQPWPLIVTPTAGGGAGFDVVQHDGLRSALRNGVQQASYGQSAAVDFDSIAGSLYPQGFAHGWQAVTCIENHDIVYLDRNPRIPALADGSNSRSWYARSRSRFAAGLLLTAPGIPQLFMGQEFLEDQQWNDDPTVAANLIDWAGLGGAADSTMRDYLGFMQDLIRLRWSQPALRGDNVNPFHIHDQNRVIAFHRWVEGTGQDVIVVATLAETTWYNYAIGFPFSGHWSEIFNSDLYDNFPNPMVAGNGGGVSASGGPLHGFDASASIVIPANGMVVFARNRE